MKFKVDENLPVEVADELRALGHLASTVADEALSGAPDSDVIRAAASEQRILLTLDKGIANIVRHPQVTHCGVVLFRPGSVGRREVLAFVSRQLSALSILPIENRITVVTERGIRSR